MYSFASIPSWAKSNWWAILFWKFQFFRETDIMFFGCLAFRVSYFLSGCGMPFFCPIFSILGLSTFFGGIKKYFFQLFGHFMSTHFWVDVECPIFFLVRHFFILGLSIFLVNEKSFFQLFGHFMSTHVWVDVECPIFFLVQHFPILGNGIFCKNFGYSKISPLGISCLLMFKWSRKAIFSYFFFVLWYSIMLFYSYFRPSWLSSMWRVIPWG